MPDQLVAMLDAVETIARNWSINDGARIAGVLHALLNLGAQLSDLSMEYTVVV